MAKIYLDRILSGAVNPSTGLCWVIGDVPGLWRGRVQELLDKAGEERE